MTSYKVGIEYLQRKIRIYILLLPVKKQGPLAV